MKQLFTALAVISMLMPACKKEKKAVAVVTTTEATNVTGSSITTGGTISDDGGSAISKRGVAWADHAGPTVGDSITNDGTGSGAFTTTINNLNANTTYYLRAYAINGSGTGYGNEITVKTANGLATISTTAISSIQPLSAVSGGNITNDGGAAVTERGVVYSTTDNPTTDNNKIVAGSGTGEFTATLSPLASQQTYYVRAYAVNSYGTAYGKEVQFNAASANTVTDIDGNVYPYVTIGTQNWMAANLKVTKYKNGDAITNGYADTGFDWEFTTTGAFSFPNGEPGNKESFGLLYNFPAINDARGICPTGWHLPSDDEWKVLEINQGMSAAEAELMGSRGTIGTKLMEGGSSGLNLQKAGILFPVDGGHYYFGERGFYYSSTPYSGISNYYRGFNGDSGDPGKINRTGNTYGMSVRCVKD